MLVGAMAAVPALMRGDLLRSDIAAWIIVVWSGLLAAFVTRTKDAAAADGGAADGVPRTAWLPHRT